DPLTVAGDDLGGPLGVLEGGGAEVDPLGAGVERPGEALVVADPTGELDGDVEVGDELGEQLGVRAPPEGGVEVDEVDPLGALLRPGPGGLARVAVGGLGAGLPLDETDGLTVDDVDGGKQLEAGHGSISPWTRALSAGCSASCGAAGYRPRRTSRGGTGWPTARRSRRRRRTGSRARPR